MVGLLSLLLEAGARWRWWGLELAATLSTCRQVGESAQLALGFARVIKSWVGGMAQRAQVGVRVGTHIGSVSEATALSTALIGVPVRATAYQGAVRFYVEWHVRAVKCECCCVGGAEHAGFNDGGSGGCNYGEELLRRCARVDALDDSARSSRGVLEVRCDIICRVAEVDGGDLAQSVGAYFARGACRDKILLWLGEGDNLPVERRGRETGGLLQAVCKLSRGPGFDA